MRELITLSEDTHQFAGCPARHGAEKDSYEASRLFQELEPDKELPKESNAVDESALLFLYTLEQVFYKLKTRKEV